MPVRPDLAVEDVSFDDLQPLFDEQSRRIDAVVGGRERLPHSLNFRGLRTQHRRVLRRWCLLAVASAAVAVFWGIDLWHHSFDVYYRVFTLFLEAVFVYIMAASVVAAVSIVRSAPARAGLGWMEHRATPAEPSKIKLLPVVLNLYLSHSISTAIVLYDASAIWLAKNLSYINL